MNRNTSVAKPGDTAISTPARKGSDRVRVLIADDHPIMQAGLLDLLAEAPDFEPVGCAGSAAETLALVQAAQPQVLVLDLMLGEDDGVDLARTLLRAHPQLGIVVLSIHDEPMLVDRLLAMGVLGYVTKNRTQTEVLSALRSASAGEVYVTAEHRARLAARADVHAALEPVGLLSERELAVLRLLATGMTYSAVATELRIAPKTVYSHQRNIRAKLGVRTGLDILRYAVHLALNAD